MAPGPPAGAGDVARGAEQALLFGMHLRDAAFLDACLTALAAQTRPANRIIVVDNGSTDDSADVARRHGAELSFEPLVGIWPAAAHGYDLALEDADIIARLDADSRWGQVVGNVVSEWVQVIGLVLLTKKFFERGSEESKK